MTLFEKEITEKIMAKLAEQDFALQEGVLRKRIGIHRDAKVILSPCGNVVLVDNPNGTSYSLSRASVERRLRGEGLFSGHFNPSPEPAIAQHASGLCWGCGRPSPEGGCSHCVRAFEESRAEVLKASGAAICHDRNSNSGGNAADQREIVAAHAAIAAYARDKKLPGAEMLATFGKLDTIKANNRLGAAVGHDPVVPDIDRHRHALSSEPLRRAANQLWSSNGGRAYSDFVGTAAQREIEMLDCGDAAADG